MSGPRRFRKGKHEEIDWGHGAKEIRKMKKQAKPASPANDLRIDDAVAGGEYSNLVAVSHGEAEFYLDFMSVTPGRPNAKVTSRIITHPRHVKRIAAALRDAIAQYESKFGPVEGSKAGGGGSA